MIPAMDAVRSKRFGYIDSSDLRIAVILHDKDVENRNNGDAWQRPCPVFIEGESSVDISEVVENAEEYEKKNFSSEFWNEAAKVYRIVSPDYDEDGSESEVNYDNIENEFEVNFLLNIVHILNEEGASHQIWHTVLEDAQWNRIEDCETGDVELFGDRHKTFTESNFKGTQYIPEPEEVKDWGLYAYNWTYDEQEVESLWVRFKGSNGNVKEYPLVESLDGLGSVVSTDPDFGTIESNHISKSVQKALENGGSVDSEKELRLIQSVNSADLSDTTSKYLDKATESQDIEQDN